jgi:hypothetical protein
MEKLTKIPSPSIPKTYVPSAMRIETKVLKNKVSKLQVPKRSLTLKKKKKKNPLIPQSFFHGLQNISHLFPSKDTT